jgi:hypothetical protein
VRRMASGASQQLAEPPCWLARQVGGKRSIPCTGHTRPTSMSWAPSHVTGIPIVTLWDNREQARQVDVTPGCAAVSVLAGQVDIAEIDGMFLRSPAPGHQVREVAGPWPHREAVSVPAPRSPCLARQRGTSWLGGGLDPGGAWAPSRQRRAIPLPTGCAPVRRDTQALFPVAARSDQVRAWQRRRPVRFCGAMWRLVPYGDEREAGH